MMRRQKTPDSIRSTRRGGAPERGAAARARTVPLLPDAAATALALTLGLGLLGAACAPAGPEGMGGETAGTEEMGAGNVEATPDHVGDAGPSLVLPGETHFARVRQLTDGGENAEAYWDPAGERLIFQSTRDGLGCDQIFVMKADGSGPGMVSSGRGRTTCAYFLPLQHRLLYSSTYLAGDDCPPRPDYSHGYVWPLYDTYDIYTAAEDGSDIRPLTDSPGYDAEATVSVDGEWIVFTSTRDGDPEIYSMRSDGTGLRRLTRSPGYDGGAFYSPDGSRIVYRGFHPTGEELAEFRKLLGMSLVRPSTMEIFVMNADGSGVRQVTSLGGANFCPYFHPDGKRIVFASNHADPGGRNFDIYIIDDDGTNLERVTTSETFDAFPMFDATGGRLVFASNRHSREKGETNIFVADWIDPPAAVGGE